MRGTRADHAGLVVGAQRGDDRARDELIAEHLPLLYNIVGRALSGHPDIDDVVQETLLRAVRDLPALRSPESFRSWLVAIALHQINSHRSRRRTASERMTVIDEADGVPAGGDLEAEVILRLHMSGQRRQVLEASRWLDPAPRAMLSLWWQEQAGWLSREEIADASRLSVAHTGVRLQRMREQLELARTIVTALAAEPRCSRLAATVADWNGHCSPVWRKRIARHTRDCPVCLATASGQVPTERLLLSVAPLAVPAALTAALAAKGLAAGATASSASGVVGAQGGAHAGALASGAHISLVARSVQVVTANPLVSLATGAVLVAGTAVVATNLPGTPQRIPAVAATPWTASPSPRQTVAGTPPAPSSARTSATATAGTLAPGAWSLESADEPGQYLAYAGDYATLSRVSGAQSAEQARRQTAFTVVRGLADRNCLTFRAADGRYLRHFELRLRLSPDDGSELFRQDATFCPRPGTVAGSVVLRSTNYPFLVLRHRDGGIWLDPNDGTKAFGGESSFLPRTPRT